MVLDSLVVSVAVCITIAVEVELATMVSKF
jgi:hypothetical protein